MPEEAPSGNIGDSAEAIPGLGEGLDSTSERAREAASEAAAEQARKKASQNKKEEGTARKHDSRFADAFVRFLQSEKDDDFLEILVNLLDRNIPSVFLLAVISLLDEEAAALFAEEVGQTPNRVNELIPTINTHLNLTQTNSANIETLRRWVTHIIVSVDSLDAETRLRLTAENREADEWIMDLIQACLLQIAVQTTAQSRMDAKQLATGIMSLIHKRPLPTA